MFKFKRTTEDKVVLGVCGGIAKKHEINSLLVRLICLLAIFFSFGIGFFIYLFIAFKTEDDNKLSDINFKDNDTTESKVNEIIDIYKNRSNNLIISAESKNNIIDLFDNKVIINKSAKTEYRNMIEYSKAYKKAYKKLKSDNQITSKKDFLLKIGYNVDVILLEKIKHVELNNNILKIMLNKLEQNGTNKTIEIEFKHKKKKCFQKIYKILKDKGLNKPKQIEEFKAECQTCENIYYFDYTDKLNQKINQYKELGNLANMGPFIPTKNMDIKKCPECGSRAVKIEKVVHTIE